MWMIYRCTVFFHVIPPSPPPHTHTDTLFGKERERESDFVPLNGDEFGVCVTFMKFVLGNRPRRWSKPRPPPPHSLFGVDSSAATAKCCHNCLHDDDHYYYCYYYYCYNYCYYYYCYNSLTRAIERMNGWLELIGAVEGDADVLKPNPNERGRKKEREKERKSRISRWKWERKWKKKEE